jgi:hypothetical protein
MDLERADSDLSQHLPGDTEGHFLLLLEQELDNELK